eukprot:CAMPEP_0202896102 /NCGR_PEP_ID=MMETSP1392-20130828/5165_1 /ASSEMBLY_ACC=CAM_ASM_000868 /TAXON_ID=225041 /ORGANISM="Chlamydomonas chlamydogama, Strain SAG 11-48b" /LENGTH=107 /DNA_ID=CAMNT_0049581337 /DNA_START=729 /DNA_END=1053 /DNA_ORIENTATION=+
MHMLCHQLNPSTTSTDKQHDANDALTRGSTGHQLCDTSHAYSEAATQYQTCLFSGSYAIPAMPMQIRAVEGTGWRVQPSLSVARDGMDMANMGDAEQPNQAEGNNNL